MSRLSRRTLSRAAGCTCFTLRKATRAVTQFYDQALRPTGLRTTQFSLLTLLRLAGTLPITKLAEEAVMDRTTLSRNLEVLERDGLVRVQPGVDARVREVELTGEGLAKLEQAFPRWQSAQRAVARHLGGRRMAWMMAGLSSAMTISSERP